MVTSRVIDDARLMHPVGFHHTHREPAPVDTVRVFVDQDKLPSASNFDILILPPSSFRFSVLFIRR
jgi:hypothetical protein